MKSVGSIAERILALMKVSGLTSGAFAERVGIQKGAVTHLTTGRNNPSFDVIVKILNAFPQLSPDWLLLGTGDMWRQQQESTNEVSSIDSQKDPKNKVLTNTPSNSSLFRDVNPTRESHEEASNTTRFTENNKKSETLKGEVNNKDVSIENPSSNALPEPGMESHCAPQHVKNNSNETNKPLQNRPQIPDIIVLQPNGRYIRYRAIEDVTSL